MDADSDHAAVVSNVDEWLARFSPSGPFPFTSHKIQTIESRRACMSDLLIFDVLLVHGGIHTPDMLFPPTDWSTLRKLLDAIDESVYDILKKDCLVYILLKWAWDLDTKEPNLAWDTHYLQDRCIAPQFAALADAYWLLDTGSHLAKSVSILSDARLNRDHVSKILQALALSSPPTSFASGNASATAALVVKYVRTAKPLLTEPDDIDLYALSLAHLSFTDAWAYQRSFPEGSDTRERLLRKIVGWCLMPIPKQEPLAHLVAFPLSPYEQSSLHVLVLPPYPSTSSAGDAHAAATSSSSVLSLQAISVLQDLLCVRAIQSGDYVGAIKLDHRFSSVSPPLGSGAPPNISSQATSSTRDTIDRKSIIQDLFATLPPAERMLLEDELGKVATGVRVNPSSTPRLGGPARRSLAGMTLSASWEDVGSSKGSPVPSVSVPPSVAGRATPALSLVTGKVDVNQSPFVSRVPRPQPTSGHQPPPVPKFTAFGSPIPPTPENTGRGVISERGKTLFSTSAIGSPSTTVKPATRVSLFDTAGSAKNAPNAFFKPPSAPVARPLLDAGSASTTTNAGQAARVAKQNGGAQRGESDDEDANMGSSSDVEVIEDRRDVVGDEEQDEDDVGNFITHDKGGSADITLHRRDFDEVMGEDDGDAELGFSVFSGSKSSASNGGVGGYGKRSVSGNGRASYVSPPRTRESPTREEDKRLSTSVNSGTPGRRRAPPGAFHHEEEEDDEDRQNENEDKVHHEDDEDDLASLTTPTNSPRRSTRTRTQAQTPSRPAGRSEPQHKSKSTTTTTQARRTSSSRPSLAQSIPGALMDGDHEDHGRDETDYAYVHGDEDTEMDEQEEDDDAIAPLPSRPSRRTRSSGLVGVSTSTSTKSKSSVKSASQAKVTATASPAKGKGKARPSDVKTPARRSSRLSTASSLSPDHTEAPSPAKKGRKSTGSRGSIAGSGSGTVPTRSSARRKR